MGSRPLCVRWALAHGLGAWTRVVSAIEQAPGHGRQRAGTCNMGSSNPGGGSSSKLPTGVLPHPYPLRSIILLPPAVPWITLGLRRSGRSTASANSCTFPALEAIHLVEYRPKDHRNPPFVRAGPQFYRTFLRSKLKPLLIKIGPFPIPQALQNLSYPINLAGNPHELHPPHTTSEEDSPC